MSQQRIWLTGSRGFIGRSLVQNLRNAQVDLTCLTQDAGIQAGVAGETFPVYVNYLDITDIEKKVSSLGMPDVFIHLGWGDMRNPDSPLHLNDNVKMARNFIETLFRLGLKKFIFIGSMNQYGSRTGLLSEDMEAQGPLTNYAKAKNEVERLGLQAAARFGKIFISVRVFYVLGADQRRGSLINDLFIARRKGESISLSPCAFYRDYIHLLDLVEGLRRICAVEQSTIINLGSGNAVRMKDFVSAFWQVMGGDVDQLKFGVRTLLPGEIEQPKSYADLKRLIGLTGWQPRLSLEDGIIKTIESLSKESI